MPDFIFLHARQRKKSKAACPAKSINPPRLKDLPSRKPAPYSVSLFASRVQFTQKIQSLGFPPHLPEIR
jgi:hypothetical protein